jgi:predicted SAM-dependent methyltransferase
MSLNRSPIELKTPCKNPWRGIYPSIAELEHRVNTSDTMLEGQSELGGVQKLLEMWEYQTRLAECQNFLTANRERAVTRFCSNEEL